jgi:CTP synthase (UTP-ammonia lyase)
VRRARIALIGDYHPDIVAHRGIDRSMALAAEANPSLTWEWMHTTSIGADPASRLGDFTGVWLAPASPYADEAAALGSITWARTRRIPFLGTCGGFQHAVLEFAREVLHLRQASHAETSPDSGWHLISPLQCSLVEREGMVHLVPGTRLRLAYGADAGEEGYHCRYGLNPEYAGFFEDRAEGQLRISARDDQGEVRAVELADHPFFVATLFQPERRALTGHLHPLVRAFIESAARDNPRPGGPA